MDSIQKTFGLSQKNWNLIENLLLAPLKNVPVKIWVYGSRARGDHKKFSDLDILLAGEIHSMVISKIQTALEESSLPIKVDIAKENNLAPSYRENIDKDKILIPR